jgi:hypothetical protein
VKLDDIGMNVQIETRHRGALVGEGYFARRDLDAVLGLVKTAEQQARLIAEAQNTATAADMGPGEWWNP